MDELCALWHERCQTAYEAARQMKLLQFNINSVAKKANYKQSEKANELKWKLLG